ncbi:MAG: antibiotic biosynthesis monooxygenase [Paracoccus sp. (in: a-proteobacteria)]|nr:antibiotic biosynthesis monooxygenase [Paracoccus sp. (in: a-proteobacteria)]
MPEISETFTGQTVICTFDVTPGTAEDLVEALRSAWDDVVTRHPGFLGGAIHMNDAQTRVASYSQWKARSDYQEMLRSPEMRARSRIIHGFARSFEPVMYEVVASYD